jgi:TolB-like protein
MSATRRLAAILLADVVGFGRLMEADEVGTLNRLKALRRETMDPCIAGHSGRIVKLMGDGVLVEFASVVDAVQCAVALQAAMGQAEPEQPADRRIALRIGVNLGDIMIDGEDIYGDGVNVAARLQSLASPGGIAISATVQEHIAGKLGVGFEDLGLHNVKNLERPVRVYRAVMEGASPPATSASRSAEPLRAEKASIAVLPFDNMSGDPEQGYFSDGITEDIITELSRFRELLVIARNSSFQYRGKAVDVKKVGRELGVQFVVEGSVRKAGNRIRVTAQLIDAASTAHIWAEKYDRELTDVFEIQDEISRTVVTRVAGHARSLAASRSRSRPTASLSAYDCFLQAREYFASDLTAAQAEPLLMRAVEIDPNFANAHALISMLHTIKYFHDCQADHLNDALASAQTALDLDPEEARANHALGFALIYLHRLEEAGHYLERAIALNPNEVFPRGDYANWMSFMGRAEDALREIEEAQRRDPFTQDWFWDVRASIEVTAGRHEDALRSYRRMKVLSPWGQLYHAIGFVELGEVAEAKACLQEFRSKIPGMTPEQYLDIRHYMNPVTVKRLLDAVHRIDAAG